MARIEEQKTVWGCEVNRAGWLHGTTRRARHFARDEDGAMFFLALLLFVFMLGFSGLATDLMKADGYRSQIQYTMDRALLAAAHPDQKNDRKTVVLDYFDRAGLSHFIDEDNVHVQVAADGTKVFAQSSISVPTPFLSFFGVDHVEAQASGGAAKVNQLTEVSLVVDVSGSMANNSATGNSKIYELRKAAKQFSNLLLCDPNDPTKETDCTITNNKTSISLVPYSSQVTVGQSLLSKYNLQDANSDSYCATFTDADFAVAGISPTSPLRQSAKYFAWGQSHRNNRAWIDPKGWTSPYNVSSPWHTLWSCFTDSWREITPFENNAQQLNQRINALGALGGTAIQQGMKWGVGLLQHDAQSVVTSLIGEGKVHGDFAGRPYNPNSTASSKFVVLMTDGINSDMSRMKDGYRTGPSPFWINSYTGVMSVRDDRGTPGNESDDRYFWFNPKSNYNRNRSTPYGTWQSHPFGEDGRSECFYDYGYGNRCTPYRNPAYTLTSRYSFQNFWKAGYTWRVFQWFPHLRDDDETASTDPYIAGHYLANHSGLEWAGFDNDNDNDGVGNVDELLLAQCDAAKNAGVTIYTIEMETPDSSAGAMSKCASVKGGQRLHYKVSGLDMSAVFNKIAEDINRLRLIN